MRKFPFLLCFLTLPLMGCSSPVNEHPKSRSTPSSSEPEIVSSEEPILPMKVLFIGNSFTFYNDLDAVTEALGKDLGLDISCDRVAIGAHHLYEFATSGDDGYNQIQAKIEANQYTHIIIQEHSTYPVSNYSTFLKGATDLVANLRVHQPAADIRLYETWGFENMVTNQYGSTIQECEQRLFEAYRNAGKALSLKVHYVGRAFSKYLTDNPSDTSLYYSVDNKHPSFLGTYLSGLIHLRSLANVNLSKVAYQGKQGHMNSYGETYVSENDKAKLISAATSTFSQYGTSY